ncbi:hypothetical protein S7711_08686 [Stachybotrys chartarum IBT 7711]|uniref:Uncharacterized protein n=1 Tax=Stachybotrys chartarum (strain CBS 109288 / IBT 7711) TaxID=1280523 RepID=A0A084AF82_STACB|nr:hypothetical protein S7711_08686 [Stachybotrys chartarum IBT 7711]KFA46483.1 hypothetical protein S40293_04255 [Stachybotrys chartarum IBT 40293]KFA77723.1 hypothetical protein S40288_00518 [Stachybotrys chartarum IBT 40288]
MHNNRPHHLLEQVPLTVSPFVSLPSATTLSYNYKTLPSTIPPSSLGIPAASDPEQYASQPKPRYITAAGSGYAGHPEDIINSCEALKEHIKQTHAKFEQDLKDFEERIRERDLAEKRKLAPGWLDSEARILEPERQTPAHATEPAAAPSQGSTQGETGEPENDEGAELDRAFGVMALK